MAHADKTSYIDCKFNLKQSGAPGVLRGAFNPPNHGGGKSGQHLTAW
jgi:hypothetical protein